MIIKVQSPGANGGEGSLTSRAARPANEQGSDGIVVGMMGLKYQSNQPCITFLPSSRNHELKIVPQPKFPPSVQQIK